MYKLVTLENNALPMEVTEHTSVRGESSMSAFLSYIMPGLLAMILTEPIFPILWKKREFSSIALLSFFSLAIIAGAIATWIEYVIAPQ